MRVLVRQFGAQCQASQMVARDGLGAQAQRHAGPREGRLECGQFETQPGQPGQEHVAGDAAGGINEEQPARAREEGLRPRAQARRRAERRLVMTAHARSSRSRLTASPRPRA